MYRCAQCVTTHTEQNDHFFITRTRVAQDCTSLCPKKKCHPRVMSRSMPNLTLTTSTSSLSPTSPIFPTFSPSHPSPLAHDPYLPCEDPRQRGGSTQIPSLTGYEPNLIEPEELEPRRIELDKNLGTDPYQTQERIMRTNCQNPVSEDKDEFGKVGVEAPSPILGIGTPTICSTTRSSRVTRSASSSREAVAATSRPSTGWPRSTFDSAATSSGECPKKQQRRLR